MDESIERIEVPEVTAPPSIADIRAMIMEMGLATSDEVQAIAGRLEKVETIVADLPTLYASTASLDKVKTSQAGYESGLRQLTGQLADVLNMQADSKVQFTTIESRLNELSGVKNLLSEFVDTQRERLNNQQTTINEVKAKTETVVKDVAFQKTDLEDTKTRLNVHFTPLQDYVLGSPTQEGLKTTFNRVFTEVHELRASVSQQSAEYAIAMDYVRSQKAAEENRRNFWQRVRLQMWTPRGLIAMLIVLVGIIMIANAFSFDQLIARIQQAAGLYQALRSGK